MLAFYRSNRKIPAVMDFIFLLQHPHMHECLCFLESINSHICGKALSLNSNELYFSFMNSKPCAISSSLKSDTIVFNVGTCLHFNNIKMEIKLQHNGVCPGISTSDSPVVRKFRIPIFTFMHFFWLKSENTLSETENRR